MMLAIQVNPHEQFADYQRTVAALGVADYSDRIIHYTSFDTLARILESKELWFGKLGDLNDTTECNHFLDALLARLPELILGHVPMLPAIIAACRAQVSTATFVSSWCEYDEPDGRLMMWRSYADDGAGVGLVVDSSQFLPSAITPEKLGFHVLSSKVDYVREEDVADHANEMLRRVSTVQQFPAAVPEVVKYAAFLLAKAPCVKHHAFHEEREIRFLYFGGLPGLSRGIAPRRLPNGREYFPMALQPYPGAGFDFSVARVLKRVVVGPKGDRSARVAAVRNLLNRHSLDHVEVVASNIPYR